VELIMEKQNEEKVKTYMIGKKTAQGHYVVGVYMKVEENISGQMIFDSKKTAQDYLDKFINDKDYEVIEVKILQVYNIKKDDYKKRNLIFIEKL